MREDIIAAGQTERNYYRDLWRYRELLIFLAWRDIQVRYKQTVIGVGWAMVRPVLTVGVLTLVFGRIAHLPAPGDVPYPLLVMVGLLPWQFFSTCLSECGNSLVGNASLVSKVYFPRLIVPAGTLLTAGVDSVLSLGILILLMAWFGFVPDTRLFALPLAAICALASAFGAGLWLCALNVKYRDVRHVVPFLVQFGLYVSPVGFSSAAVPAHWHWLYCMNPMAGVIDGFRWCLLRGHSPLSCASAVSAVAVSFGMCVTGLAYFRRVERGFADVI